MSYIKLAKLPKNGISDLIAIMARNIDFSLYGPQKVESKKRGTKIHMMHNPNVIMMNFEGFGELFSQEVILYFRGRDIARNRIGIHNDVTLHYTSYLPISNIKLVVVDFGLIGSD